MPELFHILKMISAGEMVEARQELAAVLKREPNHLEAWSLMALAVTAPAQKADCYRRVLVLDPNNENARYQLAALDKMLKAPANAPSTAVNTAGPPSKPAPIPEPTPIGPPPAASSAPVVSSIERLIASASVPPTVEPMPGPVAPVERLTPSAVVAALTMNPVQTMEQPATPGSPAEVAVEARGEGCSQQLGYFGVGLLILSVAGMFLGFASTLTAGVPYDSAPDSAAAAICYGAFALLIIPLFLYLAHKGWDTPPEMNLALKFAWLFMIALPTPWGWYWIGRGASRLVQSWANRYKPGARGRPQKKVRIVSSK